MFLTIILRKEVADEAQGQQIFDVVVNKLSDHPDVDISGNVSSTLPLTPEVI